MSVSEDEFLDFVAKEAIIDRDKLTRGALLEDLGVSSIDVITLLFEIEEKYGVIIGDSDIPPVKTLGELTDFLLGRINGAAG